MRCNKNIENTIKVRNDLNDVKKYILISTLKRGKPKREIGDMTKTMRYTGRYAVRMGQGRQRGTFGHRRRSAYAANRNESGRRIEHPAQAGKAAGEGNTATKGRE